MYFPKGFDIDRAIELGELVDQAYLQFEAFKKGKNWKLPRNYSLITEMNYSKRTGIDLIKNGGFFDLDFRSSQRTSKQNTKGVPIGFMARRKGNIYLIFRGTKTDQEWIQNFKISMVPYSLPNFGKVHDGFLHTYHQFRAAIHETLEGTERWSNLFIAGHSLGGALATIALPDLGVKSNRSSIVLYTYGSPRIGDNAFCTAFNRQYGKKSFRIVNTCDMVGLIPPPAPIGPKIGGYFSHVDTPVGFTTQNENLEKNHEIKTYLSALRDSNAKQGIFSKLKFW